MTVPLAPDPYHGLFSLSQDHDGSRLLTRPATAPTAIPDPHTGRPLRIATVELSSGAICPSCSGLASGGFITFVADARMVYACPECTKLVWLASV